jgi:PhnB protein
MAHVNPVPPGFATLTPSVTLKDSSKAIEFYKEAFAAEEVMRMPGPDGRIMHAEIRIGTSHVMMNDEVMGSRSAETLGGSPVGFYVYMENADDAYRKAVSAGCTALYPVTDMFWGDRMGTVEDPFGLKWTIATHVKDVTPEEMKKGQEAFLKQMAGAG